MKVSEALASRISARAFLDKPVEKEKIMAILEGAARAPSGGNLQPWHVWVIAGEELARFKALIAERMKTTPGGEETEYHIYPPNLKDPYRSRRYKCGEDLYATIGIGRDNKPARLMQLAKNYQFFGAPAAMFFAIDRDMQEGQWADLGMYMQSIMLLAREYGLHTCPQEAWARWHSAIREFVGMPPELMLFSGLAIGYLDEAHPINTLRTDRAPFDEYVSFRGL
ncbi:nitroreductase [Desertibaculum subflavum]|uniref:nitroreductase n=1 Tax=Desertibaculum subflavum TaxID=2268458 RepID=UPI000E66093A